MKLSNIFEQASAPQSKQQSVTEDQHSVDAVASAITRRIMMQHGDLLNKYGPEKVMAVIDDVADFAGSGGLDEIGSGDVSGWVNDVISILSTSHSVNETAYDRDLEDDEPRIVTGVYGAKSKRFTKRFPNQTAQDRWFDHADRAGNYQIDRIQALSEQAAAMDAVDTVTMDIPLLLRMLEYAREDAQQDVDLHVVTHNMIQLAKDGVLTMDQYDAIVSDVNSQEQADMPQQDKTKTYESSSVSYSHTKELPGSDASVTVNAIAQNMDELQRVLKLAGLEHSILPNQSNDTVAVTAMPVEPTAVDPIDCACEQPIDAPDAADVKYSTDKEMLMNYLRSKLKSRI